MAPKLLDFYHKLFYTGSLCTYLNDIFVIIRISLSGNWKWFDRCVETVDLYWNEGGISATGKKWRQNSIFIFLLYCSCIFYDSGAASLVVAFKIMPNFSGQGWWGEGDRVWRSDCPRQKYIFFCIFFFKRKSNITDFSLLFCCFTFPCISKVNKIYIYINIIYIYIFFLWRTWQMIAFSNLRATSRLQFHLKL